MEVNGRGKGNGKGKGKGEGEKVLHFLGDANLSQ